MSNMMQTARTEGVFAGMQLGSSSMTYDKDATTKAYGEVIVPDDVLFSSLPAPADLARVQEILSRFAPPKG